MGLLGMTVATIYQCFPTSPAYLVLGLQPGYIFRFDAQAQIDSYLLKGFALLKAEQQAFQALGFLSRLRDESSAPPHSGCTDADNLPQSG